MALVTLQLSGAKDNTGRPEVPPLSLTTHPGVVLPLANERNELAEDSKEPFWFSSLCNH